MGLYASTLLLSPKLRVGGGGVLRNNVCEISLSVPVCVRVCLSLHWDERGGGGGGGGKDVILIKVDDVVVAGLVFKMCVLQVHVCVCVCVCVSTCVFVCSGMFVCVCIYTYK